MIRPGPLVRFAVVAAIAGLGLSMISAGPGESEVPVALYLLVIGLLGVGRAVSFITRSLPVRGLRTSPLFERRFSPAPPAVRPTTLAEWEATLLQARDSARASHVRFWPRVRELARSRLADRHGVDLESQPDEALAMLGPEVYDMVRTDRPPPSDTAETGTSVAAVAMLTTRLEQL